MINSERVRMPNYLVSHEEAANRVSIALVDLFQARQPLREGFVVQLLTQLELVYVQVSMTRNNPRTNRGNT